MANVVPSWGFQVTGLECPLPCICVGPAFVSVCVCVSAKTLPAHRAERGGILYGPDGRLILSLLQREGEENRDNMPSH